MIEGASPVIPVGSAVGIPPVPCGGLALGVLPDTGGGAKVVTAGFGWVGLQPNMLNL